MCAFPMFGTSEGRNGAELSAAAGRCSRQDLTGAEGLCSFSAPAAMDILPPVGLVQC